MLSIDVSFVSRFLWKGDKNFENQTSGPIYMEDPVKCCQYVETQHALRKGLDLLMLKILGL